MQLTKEADLEYPSCPICRSERREKPYVKFGEHEVVRCQDCAMYYLYPRLTESAMRQFKDTYFEPMEHAGLRSRRDSEMV